MISPTEGKLGAFRFPYDFELFEVGKAHAAGYYEDSIGQPHVIVYRYSRNKQ